VGFRTLRSREHSIGRSAWKKYLRLSIFASGDFAFNLYWQSTMLYMLFYYTEILHLRIEVASVIYLVASVWDGIFSFFVGLAADRWASAAHYRLTLVAGAIPLGLGFIAAYATPAGLGPLTPLFILFGHILFRSIYALINIPYLAMSARISVDSQDRAMVAGMRMVAGTAAAITVALLSRPLGFLFAPHDGARAYVSTATIFAVVATAILVTVGLVFCEDDLPSSASPHRHTLRESVQGALGNRAFVTLAAAMMAMIVAVTILNKSVLYYYKYNLADENSGQLALAWMMTVGGIAVPCWMALSRRIGIRALWLIAAALSIAGMSILLVSGLHRTGAMLCFLILMQVCSVGLNFAVWAMLPDTIEYGQKVTGLRIEGGLYGIATLLQRVAIGLGTALLGLSFNHAGFDSGTQLSVTTLALMRTYIGGLPILFLALSAGLMIINPLHRDTHQEILRELSRLKDA
jgi:GPH family glycoside/pentoside/hexuronide:cation symporter